MPRKIVLVSLALILSACLAFAAAPPGPKPAPPPVAEATIAQLQAAMAAGKITSRQLVESYLAGIAMIDDSGPMLNSVIEINPDALAIADALDKERAEKGPRGPLHGIPVLLKDNIDTADQMHTTAGSLALLDSKPRQDAFLVERLRAAGAVILGKTNLSEWANFRSTKSVSGWSGRGGQTRNPYALDRNPSGSSSGSAAAVSANLTVVAVGSETDGSIVSPSSVCGVVGIKPTLGLISRAGIIPIAHSQDTAGPIARTVTDAATLLGVMTGVDPRDAETKSSDGKAQPDYTKFLDPAGLKGARIGVVRGKELGLGPKVDPILEDAIRAMRNQGATVVDVVLPNMDKVGESEFEVLLYEFKADLETYLASRPGGVVRNLPELIAFNKANDTRELAWFGQEILEQAEKKGPLTDRAYLDALEKDRRLMRDEGIDKVMDDEKLDALVAIANGPAHVTDLVNGDAFTGGSSSPAAIAGYPSITVPAGYVSGLPVGVLFFGRAWSEPTLIKFAYSFEQATKARTAPQFKPTAGVPASVYKNAAP